MLNMVHFYHEHVKQNEMWMKHLALCLGDEGAICQDGGRRGHANTVLPFVFSA